MPSRHLLQFCSVSIFPNSLTLVGGLFFCTREGVSGGLRVAVFFGVELPILADSRLLATTPIHVQSVQCMAGFYS
jgi:hypothetical protein